MGLREYWLEWWWQACESCDKAGGRGEGPGLVADTGLEIVTAGPTQRVGRGDGGGLVSGRVSGIWRENSASGKSC